MGLSTPLSFSRANMLPIVKSDATMYNLMFLFRLGSNNTGGLVKYSFIASKAFCCSFPKWNFLSLLIFSNGEKNFVLPLRFEINLLKKLTFPNKDDNCFFVEGGLRSKIAFVLLWLILMPFLCTTNTNKNLLHAYRKHILLDSFSIHISSFF